ncbi:MAG: hypothetical protein ABEI86_04885 [Halobacteriaceae archaeon]
MSKSSISAPSPFHDGSDPPMDAIGTWWRKMVKKPIVVLAFYTAIMLPFVYLPLLVGGIFGSNQLLLLSGLMGLHSLTLVVGHKHRAGAA